VVVYVQQTKPNTNSINSLNYFINTTNPLAKTMTDLPIIPVPASIVSILDQSFPILWDTGCKPANVITTPALDLIRSQVIIINTDPFHLDAWGTSVMSTKQVTLTATITGVGGFPLHFTSTYIELPHKSAMIVLGSHTMELMGLLNIEHGINQLSAQLQGEIFNIPSPFNLTISQPSTQIMSLEGLDTLPDTVDSALAEERGNDPDYFGTQTTTEIQSDINDMWQRALKNLKRCNIEELEINRLKNIIDKYNHIFRSKLDDSPPCTLDPFYCELIDGIIKPVQCKPQSNSSVKSQWIESFNDTLIELKLVYITKHSEWSSRAIAVPKHGPALFRMVLDYVRLNAVLKRWATAMPRLHEHFDKLSGSIHHMKVDFDNAYWQYLTDPKCQHLFTYVTSSRLITPNRMPQGVHNAVQHIQRTLTELLWPIHQYILIWLDDLLLHAKTWDEYITAITKFFELVSSVGLKISPKKTDLYNDTVEWCGRLFTSRGSTFHPRQIEPLLSMPIPTHADMLQQFVCATNWFRTALPRYAENILPLQKLMLHCTRTINSSKRNDLKSLQITDLWTEIHTQSYQKIRQSIISQMELAFPDTTKTLCVFTDASEHSWAVMITQVETYDQTIPIDSLHHEPVQFLSGCFNKTELDYAIVEKEAYAINEAITKFRWLLENPNGFHLYTDHKNLVFMLYPYSDCYHLSKGSAGKVSRWALELFSLKFGVYHIDGPLNDWADMYSRWASPNKKLDPTSQINTTLKDIVFHLTEVPLDGSRQKRTITPRVRFNDDSLVPQAIPQTQLPRPNITAIKIPKKKGKKTVKTKATKVRDTSTVSMATRHTIHEDSSIPMATRHTVPVQIVETPIAIRPTAISTLEHSNSSEVLHSPIPVVSSTLLEPPSSLRSDYTDFHNVGYSWITEEDDYPARNTILQAQIKYPPTDPELLRHLVKHEDLYFYHKHNPRAAKVSSSLPATVLEPIWIPIEAKDLIIRCCIAAHYGGAAHRDLYTTQNYLKQAVWWSSLEEDSKSFYNSCLACKQHNGPKIHRIPYGTTLQAIRPGEILQFDYLHIQKLPKSNNLEYILVLKDKFSKFTMLYPYAAPDSINAINAILSWIQHFGIPSILVSDRGSHFKNVIIKAVCDILQTKHHFTTAYCPWANGSVERVNRTILGMMRKIMSEQLMPDTSWPDTLPAINKALNDTPCRALSGFTPRKVLTNLDSPNPVAVLFHEAHATVVKLHVVDFTHADWTTYIDNAHAALTAMHEVVSLSNHKLTTLREARRKREYNVHLTHYLPGDFVMRAAVTSNFPHKLRANWVGPYRIHSVQTDWLYEIQDLLTNTITTCHAARLQFYHDSSLAITVELKDHVTHSRGNITYDKFINYRLYELEWQLLVKWLGYDEGDNTWESLDSCYEHNPTMVKTYLKTLPPTDRNRVDMLSSLGLPEA